MTTVAAVAAARRRRETATDREAPKRADARRVARAMLVARTRAREKPAVDATLVEAVGTRQYAQRVAVRERLQADGALRHCEGSAGGAVVDASIRRRTDRECHGEVAAVRAGAAPPRAAAAVASAVVGGCRRHRRALVKEFDWKQPERLCGCEPWRVAPPLGARYIDLCQ